MGTMKDNDMGKAWVGCFLIYIEEHMMSFSFSLMSVQRQCACSLRVSEKVT